jgi:WD40 repeat protein
VAFSPDGKWLVAGYADGSMRVWQVNDGSLLQVLKSHTKSVSGLAFSPDGKWLVSSSQDTTLRLWLREGDRFQATPVLIFSGHEGAVNSVSFSPKGTLIASGSDDGTLRIWEVPQQ